MNTKKRNKNKPCNPTNPHTPQKDEVPIGKEITEKNVEEKSEITIKSEKRVPEIICEVVTPVEAKVPEEDTPKKPKRTRGKKKKGDKEDGDEVSREISAEPLTESNKNESEIKVDKSTEESKAKTPEIPVTPAARKKKNKNKRHAEQQQEKKEDEQKLNIVPINKEEFMPDLKIINLIPVSNQGPDDGKLKKRNKKKKRLDSEKSDKAEEVISCTAAFQKLLEPKDDRKDPNKDEKVNIEISLPQETAPTPAQQEKDTENIKVKGVFDKSDAVLEKPKETFKEEGKSKKKNKKDKKFPPKPEIEVMNQSEFETCIENVEKIESLDGKSEGCAQKPEIKEKSPKPEQKLAKPKVTEEMCTDRHGSTIVIDLQTQQIDTPKVEEYDSIEEGESVIQPPSEKEKSSKPKAKIAKPVEKKNKGKTYEQKAEDVSYKIDTLLGKVEEVATKAEVTQSDEITESQTVTEQLLELPREEIKIDIEMKVGELPKTEQMQVPEHKGKKKRKKSPKPSKDASLQMRCELDDIIPIENLIERSEQKDVKAEETVLETQLETKISPITIPVEISLTQNTSILQVQSLPFISKEEMKQVEELKPNEPINIVTPLPPSKNDNKKGVDVPEIIKIADQKQESSENDQAIPIPLSSTEEPTKPAESLHISNVLSEIRDTESQTEIPKTKQMPLPQTGNGKKRKKSPKPSKIDVTPVKSLTMEVPQVFDISEELITTEATPTPLSFSEEPPELTESIEISNLPLEIKDKRSQIDVPIIEKMPLQQTGSGEQRRKPKKSDVTSEKPEEKVDQKTIVTEIDAKDIQESKESLDLPPLEDIEIRSVKAEESDGSICDIVPEVHHPRATSLDTNNNMIIREITAVEEGKLNIPIVLPDTPFIQGSGESPTPVISPTGITITEVDTIPKSDENTNLKSKVIEVNKDMEELRRSIERSLAELTAMEKREEQTEKKFEEAQAKIEAIKNLATKQETSSSKEQIEIKKRDPKSETEATTQVIEQKNLVPKLECQEIINETEKTKTKQTQITTSTNDKMESLPVQMKEETKVEEQKSVENIPIKMSTPPPPPRKDNKGKNKKKKGKQEAEHVATPQSITESAASTTGSNAKESKTEDTKTEEKSEQKTDSKEEKGKQQAISFEDDSTQPDSELGDLLCGEFEPIESFEDALMSNEASEDVNKTFEIIANEVNSSNVKNNPEINVTAPTDDDEKNDGHDKVNPVSQPKNLLGHPDIPARLNRTDYKKEKNKTPNTRQAKVKIKDSVPIEVNRQSKESQTENKRRFLKDKTVTETVSSVINDDEEYIYKYSFRRVFLPSACHTCKKGLKFGRYPCNFCNLVFYCGPKHRDEDYPQHQALCFAVSTIAHLKEQKHLYGDAQGITGQDYRLLRMQMIVSCEKVLKRRLVPWEQETLLYPRICADVGCREWRQGKLDDCEGCEQISYCSDNPNHLPKTHQRWCKSYSLYQKLVTYQQTRGRLEPKLPGRVMSENFQIPEKMNEILATMYEERIDMNDIQYAALTQIATAPLTAAYCQQLYATKIGTANGMTKKSTFTIHVVGAELQFEADALHKWEVFFLHLRPDVKNLRLVLIGPDLNPSNLPLDLLAKIKLCENCRQNERRVTFEFQDKKTYYDYWSTDFTTPDLVCAFNPSIERSSIYNGKDTWPSAIKCIIKQKVPFLITSYTLEELNRDLSRIQQCSDVDIDIISEPMYNPFASVRPDRNFISDDEIPLLLKNFCYMVVCGRF